MTFYLTVCQNAVNRLGHREFQRRILTRIMPLNITIALAAYLGSHTHNPDAGTAVVFGLAFGWAGLMTPVLRLGQPYRRGLVAVLGGVLYAMSIYVGLMR